MKDLTPILSRPAARERVGWMTEQALTDIMRRKAAKHEAAWWHDQDRAPRPGADNAGCMFAIVVAGCIVFYVVGFFLIF